MTAFLAFLAACIYGPGGATGDPSALVGVGSLVGWGLLGASTDVCFRLTVRLRLTHIRFNSPPQRSSFRLKQGAYCWGNPDMRKAFAAAATKQAKAVAAEHADEVAGAGADAVAGAPDLPDLPDTGFEMPDMSVSLTISMPDLPPSGAKTGLKSSALLRPAPPCSALLRPAPPCSPTLPQ
jgi:hypothetical protein